MEPKPPTHPDFGELEAFRRGEAEAATADHVADCAACRRSLEEIESVAAVVRGSESPFPSVPDEIETRILWNARQNAARVRRTRPAAGGRRRAAELRQHIRSNVQGWAIAATLLLSIATVAVWRQMNRGNAPAPQAQLDIVDALTLARQLAAAQPALRQAPGERPWDRRYDVNHDGRVDAADVDLIVRQAVALGDA